MELNRRQQSEVLFGDRLHDNLPTFHAANPVCRLNGTTGTSSCCIPLDPDIFSKHILFLGGIGTGKTNAFYHIISQLQCKLTANDVMVIFDTKGDFYREFYRPGDIVISNDNTATGSNGPDYWNIFEEIDTGDRLMENLIEISKSIFAVACEKTNQIFFPNAARDIFMAILYHMIQSLPKEKRTNQNLLTVINQYTAPALRDLLNKYDMFRAMTSYIAIDDSPQTQGVLSELQQVSREFLIGNFAKHGNLGLRQLVRNKGGKTIFIEYDLGIGGMLSPAYSLMFDMAIKEALCRSRSEGNVYFICDEFKLLPNLNHIDDAVNFGRSLGVKFLIGVQNVEQIYENYGEERARSILSGFSSLFAFRVNDAKSRDYIQGIFGKNQKLETYLPRIQKNGIIENQREGNVVEDWDIARLQIGEAIVGFPGCEPFRFQFSKF